MTGGRLSRSSQGGARRLVHLLVAVSSLLRPYDENGAWCVAHDRLGHAAEQGAPHATASVTTDHNSIGRPFLGGGYDCRRGLADLHELQCGRPQRQTLAKAGKQSLALLLRKGNQFIACDPALGHSGEGGVNGVDERHAGRKGPRKLAADFGRVRCHRFTIDCKGSFGSSWNFLVLHARDRAAGAFPTWKALRKTIGFHEARCIDLGHTRRLVFPMAGPS